MRQLLLTIALTLTLHSTLISQVQINSIQEVGSSPFVHYDIGVNPTDNMIYVNNSGGNGTYPIFLKFDQNLNLLDTLTGVDINRPTANILHPFIFKKKLFFLAGDYDNPRLMKWSYHSIVNGVIMDSVGLNLDSINLAYPNHTRVIDQNTLQLLVPRRDSATNTYFGTSVLHLDSNFNFKSYHRINLGSLPNTNSPVDRVYEINDSLWHIFQGNFFTTYNPKTKTVLHNERLTATITNWMETGTSDYIGLGTVSSKLDPNHAGWQSTSSLGFYQITHQGDLIDTIQFNSTVDSNSSTLYTNYSSEYTGTYITNSVVYNQNAIYLASASSIVFNNPVTNKQNLFIVKTNLNGDLIWKYEIGGIDYLASLSGMSSTPDSGCIVSGNIMLPSGDRFALLLKFGPDGNLSNLEFTAPEDVIQFYPNPIRNKLNYSFAENAEATFTLEITDIQGRQTTYYTLNNQNQSIDVNIRPGFYIYQVKDRSSKVTQVGKFQVIR